MDEIINKQSKDTFIMKPRYDYAFKLIFGDEKNKELLIDLLSSILNVPKSEFDAIRYINNELLRRSEMDKKGILDIQVKTQEGKLIDVEIQLLCIQYMPERSLYYWSRMYDGQIKKSDGYGRLRKCITINILGYEYNHFDKIHTKYHLWEDELRYKLTDVLEIHFIELPKLDKTIKDLDHPAIDWLKFINADEKEVMEMLAKKNEYIKKAYKVLRLASMDEGKRRAYEAREAAIRDEITRLEEAMEEGEKRGEKRGEKNVAKELLKMGIDIKQILQATKLTIDEINEIKKDLNNIS